MKRTLLLTAVVMSAWLMQSTAGVAQTDTTVPGGATGANVFCMQVGDVKTGAFQGTFMQTRDGFWESRTIRNAKRIHGGFTEITRDVSAVTLSLSTQKAAQTVQFDFVNKVIKFKLADASNENWKTFFLILHATDKAASEDCVALAALNAKPPPAAGAGLAPVQMITIAPKTVIVIPPGTNLTATSGPPCPGNPGFFLCPNEFTCAPAGGVCCPGAGSCNAGTFCDAFVAGNCVTPGDAKFCAGTGNVRTGNSLHCSPGKSCFPDKTCG